MTHEVLLDATLESHYVILESYLKRLIVEDDAASTLRDELADGLLPLALLQRLCGTAVCEDNAAAIHALCDAGVVPSELSVDQRARSGRCRALSALVKRGLPPTYDLLEHSVINNNELLCRALMSARVDVKGAGPLLQRAARRNAVGVLQALVGDKSHSVDIDYVDGSTLNTALMVAVKHANVEAVAALVDAGADLTLKSHGETALQMARSNVNPHARMRGAAIGARQSAIVRLLETQTRIDQRRLLVDIALGLRALDLPVLQVLAIFHQASQLDFTPPQIVQWEIAKAVKLHRL
eukprot:TRINITY_DN9833_c0_g1_i1.p1 TRINITY_DN9833_c0_g1~~TRINITY_DN9833_c0_g1_i1.p1  ORF type:complete len:295 (-),score=71.09 TRINITY_DN9833_c0_g1_i1:4-888(-)